MHFLKVFFKHKPANLSGVFGIMPLFVELYVQHDGIVGHEVQELCSPTHSEQVPPAVISTIPVPAKDSSLVIIMRELHFISPKWFE